MAEIVAHPSAATRGDDVSLDTAALAVCASVLEQGTAELRRRFGPTLGEDAVDRHIEDSLEELRRTGVSSLHRESTAIHFAESRLSALAEARGGPEGSVPSVLFVCRQNAVRSQLAAALLAERAGHALRVRSAGARPAAAARGDVTPVLTEFGVGPEAFPQPLTEEILFSADWVVTLGCGDDCTVVGTTRLRDWPVGDPAEADWQRLQEIVADIERRVEELWAEIQESLAA